MTLHPDVGGTFTLTSAPAANTQATVTHAATAGVTQVCTSITASISGSAAAAPVDVVLRDGATGVGAILWTATLACVAGTAASVVVFNVNIPGSNGNAMTLEFFAAGGLNTSERVSLTGYTII